MRVSYSPKLADYLAKQQYQDLLISTFKPKGCATLPEHVVTIVSPERVQELVDNNTFCIDGELGRVFIARSWVPDDKDACINLDITNFFGSKTIRATGLKPFKMI